MILLFVTKVELYMSFDLLNQNQTSDLINQASD